MNRTSEKTKWRNESREGFFFFSRNIHLIFSLLFHTKLQRVGLKSLSCWNTPSFFSFSLIIPHFTRPPPLTDPLVAFSPSAPVFHSLLSFLHLLKIKKIKQSISPLIPVIYVLNSFPRRSVSWWTLPHQALLAGPSTLKQFGYVTMSEISQSLRHASSSSSPPCQLKNPLFFFFRGFFFFTPLAVKMSQVRSTRPVRSPL